MTSQPLAFVPGVKVARARHAEGLLSGLSFAVKDNIAVRGHASGAGHPAYAKAHAPSETDAPCVTQLLDAGADLVGVTIMDELAYSLVGKNEHYGTPANPRAPGHVCGGSSCGSAAAVASCLCDFALGTDTGGSVRVPASFCGLFGLRPTHGAISSEGVVPLAKSFDTVGFFSRDPRTFEQVAEVLLGATPPMRVKRVLVADDALELCDAGVFELLDGLVQRVGKSFGVELERIKLARAGFAPFRTAFRRIQAREAWHALGGFIDAHHPRFSQGVGERFDAARDLAASDEGVEEDQTTREQLTRELNGLLEPGTLLFMPAAPGIAPRLDASEPSLQEFRTRTLELTSVASLTGLPQLVVPARELSAAPLGLSFIGPRDSDGALSSLATILDRILGGS